MSHQDWVMVMRLALATFLGAVIGFQREWSGKEAGLRTNMLICLGSALLTLLSIYAFPGDVPGRVAAGIVAGIGFIGAGVILHRTGGTVVGLTTAATIWVVAGIGMAAGAGQYVIAPAATVLVLVTLLLPHFHKPNGQS
ncbi:MAG: MgtC/SapB family protein [Dehalococcoidales bacterium]|jgi:putative Mg2+ transporter-C (MgtC) family protein